jgi:hypothetical protein
MERKKRLKKKLAILLKLRESIRERNYLTKACLVLPCKSPWQTLYETGNDQNFINVVGITRQGFNYLLIKFDETFTRQWNCQSGRPPTLKYKHAILGLVLTFYCDKCCQKALCLEFGVPPATLSRLLLQAEIALDRALKCIPESKILWPSLEEQYDWGKRVEKKYPLLKGRWGFIDGKNLKVKKPTATDMQNAMFNGWLHATLITGVFCFGADGCLIWGKHNCVGSWNDGEISRPFQEKICREDINLPGHGVVADTAFPANNNCFQRITTPLKNNEIERAHPRARPAMRALESQITSCRQACEWGMGAMEKVYQRLLDELPYDQDRRGLRIRNICRLYNFRVRMTGISEILNVFRN